MKKHLTLLLLALAVLCACSDNSDDAKYASYPPTFDAVTVENVTRPEATDIRVGDKLLVTAHQSKKGRLLYKGTYHWGSQPVEGLPQAFVTTVVYDNNPANPVDTVYCNAAGSYTLTFTGRYDVSGNTNHWSGDHSETFADGSGRAQYTRGGIMYYQVVVTSRLTVLAAE